MRQIKLAMC